MHYFSKPLACVLLKLCILSNTDYASGQEFFNSFHQHNIRPGILVTTAKPAIILEGPDAGKTLRSGQIATVCRAKDNRLRISGAMSGWINSKNVLEMPIAAEIWVERAALENASSTTLADAALII